MSATNYDTIATEYQQCKEQPWRLHIEHSTLFELLGDLKGKTVLDLACGEGHYSRKLMRAGAAGVLGVDVSHGMIELARSGGGQGTARCPLPGPGCRQTGGGRDLRPGAGLLPVQLRPQSRDELLALAKPACRSLKPGGRLVAVNNNQDEPVESMANSRKYGFIKSVQGELREGTPITYTIFLDDGSFQIDNYYLRTPTHEEVLRAAGFRDIEWHRPRVSPAGLREFGEDYWREFQTNPPVIFIECRK